jgi:hypothetical protein
MRERQVERALVDGVRAKGGICAKWVAPGQRGVPDRIIVIKGKVFFVELKSPTGKLEPWQMRFIQRLKDQGRWVYVLRNLKEVKDFVNEVLP